ncbi:hypothetical protein HYC85_010568 [Camellia sinensis]|uniref:Uncharacterized protein n=1 Tax=Camellia sinensis TaxID=4442 RepID=A0A7J7HKW0_CAMSI|nr:hypothetical protein HYC85_010568 [Camellia sinensis]
MEFYDCPNKANSITFWSHMIHVYLHSQFINFKLKKNEWESQSFRAWRTWYGNTDSWGCCCCGRCLWSSSSVTWRSSSVTWQPSSITWPSSPVTWPSSPWAREIQTWEIWPSSPWPSSPRGEVQEMEVIPACCFIVIPVLNICPSLPIKNYIGDQAFW